MKRLAQEGDILIREMEETPEDLGLFLKWMTDPETMKYWEGMTVHFDYDRVLQNYRESLEEQVDQCLKPGDRNEEPAAAEPVPV